MDKPTGAPRKDTPALIARLLKGFRLYGTNTAAAAYCGISRATLARWTTNSPELVEQIEDAKGAFEASCLRNIRMAGKKPQSWPANAWLLERMYPEKYSQRSMVARVDMGDNEQIPINIAIQIQNVMLTQNGQAPLPAPQVAPAQDDDIIDVPSLPAPEPREAPVEPAPRPAPAPVPIPRRTALLAAAGRSRTS